MFLSLADSYSNVSPQGHLNVPEFNHSNFPLNLLCGILLASRLIPLYEKIVVCPSKVLLNESLCFFLAFLRTFSSTPRALAAVLIQLKVVGAMSIAETTNFPLPISGSKPNVAFRSLRVWSFLFVKPLSLINALNSLWLIGFSSDILLPERFCVNSIFQDKPLVIICTQSQLTFGVCNNPLIPHSEACIGCNVDATL